MEVDVTGGRVRGTREGGVLVWRGIPFASLPVRFGAPAPVEPWSGVRETNAFGPPPPQSATVSLAGAVEADTGWLTVNVWSADLAGRAPVMVWVQGGGYLFGTSGLPEYDGVALARRGVVVVTLNYRVGLEGFGLVPGSPPNRGLLDQVAALEWVRDNIAGFGGDPGSVTVFGQSAGGGSVAALLVMPRATGLLHRAIVQSMPGTYFTPELATDLTGACADELGVAPADLASVDPWLLPAAADAVLERMGDHVGRWGPVAAAGVPCAPVVDGDVLPTTPWAGLTGAVPLVVGHTRHEQRLLSFMQGRLGQVTDVESASAAMIFASDPDAYRAAFTDPDELDETVRSDWLFRMPSLMLGEAQVAAGGTAFVYELTWPAPGLGGVLGACHGLDVPLVFGNLTVGHPAILIGDAVEEAAVVSGQMQAAWVAFARDGDPGWPAFDSGATRIFDTEATVADYPERRSRALWTDAPDPLGLPVSTRP